LLPSPLARLERVTDQRGMPLSFAPPPGLSPERPQRSGEHLPTLTGEAGTSKRPFARPQRPSPFGWPRRGQTLPAYFFGSPAPASRPVRL
jgi:hypothetical protein